MNSSHPFAEVNGFGQSPPVNSERKTIPFDYTFRYDLKGVRDTVHNKTVTVSIESTFTAVSIGYGVVPKVDPIKFGIIPPSLSDAIEAPTLAPNVSILRDFFAARLISSLIPALEKEVIGLPSSPSPNFASQFRTMSAELFTTVIIKSLAETVGEKLPSSGGVIGDRTATVLKTGFKCNPLFAEKILIAVTSGQPLDPAIVEEAFQAVAAPPDQIQFLYAIYDDGSGREFQSEPILNIAGLGTADGKRPFRYFAQPIQVAPQSTIRMQVTEVSEFAGELHVSLQGYKTLGAPGTPTGSRQARRTGRIRR